MSLAPTRISLASLPTGRLHDVLAESGPGPAGGSAAALRHDDGLRARPPRRARLSRLGGGSGIAAQAAALGDRSLVFAEDDHLAYAHALEQLRAPDRDATLGRALRRAAEIPLQISETAADVATLAALAARDGAATVRGDAWAAATLAEAASVAAARLVHVNLATHPDDELCTRADAAAEVAAAARDVALAMTWSSRPLPAWSLPSGEVPTVDAPAAWRDAASRDWAIAGSTGDVDVCIVDSGIESGHPLVGDLAELAGGEP